MWLLYFSAIIDISQIPGIEKTPLKGSFLLHYFRNLTCTLRSLLITSAIDDFSFFAIFRINSKLFLSSVVKNLRCTSSVPLLFVAIVIVGEVQSLHTHQEDSAA